MVNAMEPTARVTRSRAAVIRSSGSILGSKVSKPQDQKQVLPKNYKRAASDQRNTIAPETTSCQKKRRGVLKDITNVCCNNSYTNCLHAAKVPVCVISFNRISFHDNLFAIETVKMLITELKECCL